MDSVISWKTAVRAYQVGLATGIRSMVPLAAVSWAVRSNRLALPHAGLLSLFRRPEVAPIALLAAVGESIADKALPLPNRTTPGPLVFRIVLGAIVGAVICVDEDESPFAGAVVGATAAIQGAFMGRRNRHRFVEAGGPDWVAGIVGDARVLSLVLPAVFQRKSKVA